MNEAPSRRHRRGAAPGGRALLGALALALAAHGCGVSGAATADADAGGSAAARAEAPAPPAVDELSDTFATPFALASAILEGIHDGDYEQLLRYRIDESEWYHIVWPELPSSRPERGLSWDYAWRDLDQKSRNAILQTIDRHRGREYRLLRVEFADETTDYGAFRVHRDARCVVETDDGHMLKLDLFGSVIERKGRFKAFSYVVD